ncbi:MAG: hypothetical protein ACYDAN_07300 [Candidatus Limnocylindrales bacterium]
MTPFPADPIDPREATAARRVRELSERAVVPIDALAIARAAAGGPERRRFGWMRAATASVGGLGWVLVAGLLALAAVGGVALSGGDRAVTPITWGTQPPALSTPVPATAHAATTAPVATTAPAATSVPTAQPVLACAPGAISARVTGWTGAAGQRIASLAVTNTGSAPCLFPSVTRPQLVDGTGSILIDGTWARGGTTLRLAAGARLTTTAEDGNYCGPTPAAPVTVAIVLGAGARVVAAPVSPTDTFGLPPCMGSGSAAYVTMHAWQP